MPQKIYSPTAEDAVLALDKAFSSRVISNVYAVMPWKDNSFQNEVLEGKIKRMGFDIFQRDDNIFIKKESENGLDNQKINLTRKAIMFDGIECRETFITEYTNLGWQVSERINIYIKKKHPTNDSMMMRYKGQDWIMYGYIPWLRSGGIILSLDADRIADERNPTNNQLETVERIIEYKEDFVPRIAEKAYEYIKNELSEWLCYDWNDIPAEELTEAIGDFTFIKPSSPKDALHTLQPPFYIHIGEDVDPNQSIEFTFSVYLKSEGHGLCFLIKDWEIIEYGPIGSI